MERIQKDRTEEKDGFRVVYQRVIDRDADTSYLGEYTDEQKPGVIVRSRGVFIEDWPEDDELPSRGLEYRYFLPYAGGEKVGSEHYKEYGLQDYKRAESLNRGDWCYVGVVVKVYRAGVELAEDALWGIESDSSESFFAETEGDVASEAIENARKTLAELCKGGQQ